MKFIDLQAQQMSLEEIGSMAKNSMMNEGFIVFRNFHFDLNNLDSTKRSLIRLCELIGTPISHDQNNSIVWDIKPNSNSNGLVKTYSEHNHAAELHTDSQYSEYPEDTFALLSLKKAQCGGGLSHLQSLVDVSRELNALPDGEKIINTLSSTDYPFIVPNVFKKGNSKEHEFNFGPILRQNEIRFRIDTFEKAFDFNKSFCTDDQLYAYTQLKKIVTNPDNRMEFMMEPGDLIFINNKTMLHGRSSFDDSDRHMLRIRMNKRDYRQLN
jgi:alpha-ketoglutarate-dependent taurine dioxygenase